MSFENPMTFVRSIKGASASILLALLFTGRPMTNQELQRWTGYSESTISQATHMLLDLGWLSALGPRGPWTLTPGRQLPLGVEPASPEIRGSLPTALKLPRRRIHGSRRRLRVTDGSSHEIQGSSLSSSSSSRGENLISSTHPQNKKEDPEDDDDANQDPGFLENRAALHKAGIREPAAGRLARLAHVNPAYIAAHVGQAAAQGLPLGTAIYRIKHGWPVATPKAQGRTPAEKMERFLAEYRDQMPAEEPGSSS
jgi:hypothetical protein